MCERFNFYINKGTEKLTSFMDSLTRAIESFMMKCLATLLSWFGKVVENVRL